MYCASQGSGSDCDVSVQSEPFSHLRAPASPAFLLPAVSAELEILNGIGLRGFRDEVSLPCPAHCVRVCARLRVRIWVSHSLAPSVDGVKYALGSIILNSPRNSI